MNSFIQRIKYNKMIMRLYSALQERIHRCTMATDIPEVRPLLCRKSDAVFNNIRCNLLVPSLNPKHVFGGITTALSFYNELCESMQCICRIIVLDAEVDVKNMVELDGFRLVDWEDNIECDKQIVDFCYRTKKTLAVTEQDVFMATSWWSAYLARKIIVQQQEMFGSNNQSLLYFIQDYEPGFYQWSSKYLMAESTYKMDIDVMAIVNSKLLYDFFKEKKYNFRKMWYFEPKLNDKLQQILENIDTVPERKKQILIYGRPGTARNAFELIVEALRDWAKVQDDVEDWTILSAGEKFEDIVIEQRIKIKSLGKLSLEEYAKIMLESKIGISLMVSPHPSYPPLEMAAFGMRVITNSFENKNLSQYSDNIISLDDCSANNIAKELHVLCNERKENIIDNKLVFVHTKWDDIAKEVKREWKQ